MLKEGTELKRIVDSSNLQKAHYSGDSQIRLSSASKGLEPTFMEDFDWAVAIVRQNKTRTRWIL